MHRLSVEFRRLFLFSVLNLLFSLIVLIAHVKRSQYKFCTCKLFVFIRTFLPVSLMYFDKNLFLFRSSEKAEASQRLNAANVSRRNDGSKIVLTRRPEFVEVFATCFFIALTRSTWPREVKNDVSVLGV